MKHTQTMMSLALAGVLACAAPLALAQTSTDTPNNSMQHPQSGAVTHTPPYTAPPPTSGATESSHSSTTSRTESNMSTPSMGDPQMMGEHSMSGTVESVSSKGIVELKSDGIMMRVHFPHASQNLKKGDKITVQLGYTKDSGSPAS